MSNYDEKLAECPICGYSEEFAALQAQKAPDALTIETILQGRFIVGRILSINYFSILYLAWDALLSRRVVIRELFPYDFVMRDGNHITPRSDEAGEIFSKCISQFEEETAMLASCQDLSFILNYYRFFHENGTVYTYTEYLEGVTLKDAYSKGLSDELKDRYITSIKAYIHQLHDRQLIHGNISPSSIYICADGSLKLIDFGMNKRLLCRQIGDTRDIIDVSYSAPEILEEDVSGAIDIYSVGAVYYWLLTGKDPSLSKGRQLSVKNKRANKAICRMTDRNPDRRILDAE